MAAAGICTSSHILWMCADSVSSHTTRLVIIFKHILVLIINILNFQNSFEQNTFRFSDVRVLNSDLNVIFRLFAFISFVKFCLNLQVHCTILPSLLFPIVC